MKPDWQQQNAAQRAQQEMAGQQQRMQQMAYYQQQQIRQAPPSQSDWQPRSNDEFGRVEQEVSQLQEKLAAGKMDRSEFEQALKKLIIADDQGRWWMLGTESRTWYRHDGASWVVDIPPGRSQPRAVSIEAPQHEAPSPVNTFSRPGFGFWFQFLLITVLTTAIGFSLASLIGGFKLLGPNLLSRIMPGILIGLLIGIGQLILIGKYIQGGMLILLGYIIAGAIIGDSPIRNIPGLIMGLGGALPGFFILKREYEQAWLFLILQPVIFMFTWGWSSSVVYYLEARPWGPNPMIEVLQFSLIKGAAAGVSGGAVLGMILLIILRRPKHA